MCMVGVEFSLIQCLFSHGQTHTHKHTDKHSTKYRSVSWFTLKLKEEHSAQQRNRFVVVYYMTF